MSLPHLPEFGWKPTVLSLKIGAVEGVEEPLLLETVPKDVRVLRAGALPVKWTRKIGIGNAGLRALPFLYRLGCRLLREHQTDLVFFSTTMFPLMSLGRVWKRKFGVPFVLDFQDPWVNDYPVCQARRQSLKSTLARRMHETLEPWTVRAADGLMAVSEGYIDALRRRYPWIEERPSCVLPFGASEEDFRILRARPQLNRFFRRQGGRSINGVYVGRGGDDMAPAFRIIFAALRRGLEQEDSLFSRLRLYFIGTDYAPAPLSRKTVEPIAQELGVQDFVTEYPRRIPYFEALQLLADADFLLVPGSDDPTYTASKIYPYVMARKPLIGVFHRCSSVVDFVSKTACGEILPFDAGEPFDICVGRLGRIWKNLLERLPFVPGTRWEVFRRYTAAEMTRRQCELFDEVLDRSYRTG